MDDILQVDRICKNYKNFRLKDISFELKYGTITGFIGENGAGKTTTLEIILQLIKSNKGIVKYKGEVVKNPKDLKGVAYLENNRDVYPNVKLKEYKNFIMRAYKRSWNDEKYKKFKEIFEFDERKKLKDLSTGTKVKFFIAIELAKQPDLLILDEPTSGLDPIVRNELLEILINLVKEDNITIFFSSHITSDIENIADNVIFINNGSIVLDGVMTEIKNKYVKAEFEDINNFDQAAQAYIQKNGKKNMNSFLMEYNDVLAKDKMFLKSASLDEILLYLKEGYVNA